MLLICYVDVFQALNYCVKMLIDEYKEKICFMDRCSLDLKLKFIITLVTILSYRENGKSGVIFSSLKQVRLKLPPFILAIACLRILCLAFSCTKHSYYIDI